MNLQSMDKDELQAIGDVLDEALEAGLEVEVIYWALKAMKENPLLTIPEAMALGITEWIK